MSLKRIALLLAGLILLAGLPACGGSPEPADLSSAPEPVSDPASPAGKEYIFINTLPELVINNRFPRQTSLAAEKHELNDDVVGWLSVPGTAINEEVLYKDDGDNRYYERKGIDEKYSLEGVFYGDFRDEFGDGFRSDLRNNTVIYGHNLGAEFPEDLKFGPLMRFTEEEFAKETPYLCFSTLEEDMVWEVFAVFYATIQLPYNRPDLTDEEFVEILDESRSRSLYDYESRLGAKDKILTLSTCCYSIPGNDNIGYPSDYRFVVMAKLVDTAEATKEEAVFQANESPKEP